jgi:hypothetical protein
MSTDSGPGVELSPEKREEKLRKSKTQMQAAKDGKINLQGQLTCSGHLNY